MALADAREECGARVRSRGDWLACQPLTYMNRSGSAVRCLGEGYALEAEGVLVVYDDIHLPLGRLRLRAGGSAAGHRGLESVIGALQTEAIPRLRLGVGTAPPELRQAAGEPGLTTYVLSPFPAEEAAAAEAMIVRAAAAAAVWMETGLEAAMNLANAPERPAPDLPGGSLSG